MNHRHGTVAHGVHLAQAAGLALGGHQVDVAGGVNPGSQTHIEGDLGGNLLGELLLQLPEEGFVLGLAGADEHQLGILLPHQPPGDVAQKVQTLVPCQPGDHDHHGRVRIYGQAQLLLQSGLALGFAGVDFGGAVLGGQIAVGLRIEDLGVDAVGDARQLPGVPGQDAVQTVGVVGIHQLPGVGLGNGGHQVGGFNGALHHVYGAVHIQAAPVLPGQTQHVVEEAGVGPALILDVVDGVHTPGMLQGGGVVGGFQVNGNHGRLPVVALDHIRGEFQGQDGIQAGLGEVGEPLAVIHVAVDGAGTGAEIVVVVDEVDLEAPGTIQELPQGGVLLPPAHLHPELGHLLCLIGGIGFDLVVVGQEQNHLIALDSAQGSRQGLHHVSKSAGFGVRGRFRCADGNFHTVSPRLMTMGLLRVPMSFAPGRTVMFLSRITFFSSAPSPMTVSFITTQSSIWAPGARVT